MQEHMAHDGEMDHMVIEGAKAVEYAHKQLKKVSVDVEKWEILYIDEATGEKWIMDFLHGEMHGGGIPRLRKIG